jgi:hypothetical protein
VKRSLVKGLGVGGKHQRSDRHSCRKRADRPRSVTLRVWKVKDRLCPYSTVGIANTVLEFGALLRRGSTRYCTDRETKANKANLVFSLFLLMTVSVANTLDRVLSRLSSPKQRQKLVFPQLPGRRTIHSVLVRSINVLSPPCRSELIAHKYQQQRTEEYEKVLSKRTGRRTSHSVLVTSNREYSTVV